MELVTPGQEISCTDAFLRGHGTYVVDGRLLASVAGVVQRVNKLVSVVPLRSRYAGNVGDVIIGRVLELGQKRWLVDVCSSKGGILLLSSINLPSGEQRRRTQEDSLNMREIYAEGDLVSAEVHSVMHDGAISLHTRNDKYGKLRHGILVEVPPVLIRRTKHRFHSLPAEVGVDMIIAANGLVWLSASGSPEEVTAEQRGSISRVRNAVLALSRSFIQVDALAVMGVYSASVSLNIPPARMFDEEVLGKITAEVRTKQDAKAGRADDDDA
mmetsp:Transcript_25139/g.59975  ORF Transcript_25139/g.59975 Transcript_25139/m.59975 type:complete len:270 (+) Transcript_25139:230-1039(+)